MATKPAENNGNKANQVQHVVRDVMLFILLFRRVAAIPCGVDIMGLIVLVVILMLLSGGGGFYYGAPYHYYGGGFSLLLLMLLLILLFRR